MLFFRNFDYADVHVEGASRIAEISAANGVSRFVHVSHLNASHDSPSHFYRTKAQGEDAVLKAFPDATIVRPGSYYGHEDKLLNSMACKSSIDHSTVNTDSLVKVISLSHTMETELW
jgi:NADH dehydrogenase (ubiquinone) 1 alpha subcomplex subunit 9